MTQLSFASNLSSYHLPDERTRGFTAAFDYVKRSTPTTFDAAFSPCRPEQP